MNGKQHQQVRPGRSTRDLVLPGLSLLPLDQQLPSDTQVSLHPARGTAIFFQLSFITFSPRLYIQGKRTRVSLWRLSYPRPPTPHITYRHSHLLLVNDIPSAIINWSLDGLTDHLYGTPPSPIFHSKKSLVIAFLHLVWALLFLAAGVTESEEMNVPLHFSDQTSTTYVFVHMCLPFHPHTNVDSKNIIVRFHSFTDPEHTNSLSMWSIRLII